VSPSDSGSAASGSHEELVVVGLSHRTAPIEVRERFALAGARLEAWIERLLSEPGVSQCVVLSTCNRTECYVVGDARAIEDRVARALIEEAGVAKGRAYLSSHVGLAAVQHLFRVTSGLDSLVIGEPQIQGQVSEAYHGAEGATLGSSLHRLFQSALAAGGRVRSSTAISRGSVSIPAAAVGLARKVFGSLEGRSVLVIGTGEMGRLTVRCLRSEGVERVFVASRTLARAERMGRQVDGIPMTREAFPARLAEVDLVVTATDADAAFVTPALLEGWHDEARQTVILDIALPRNVHPSTAGVPGIFLYNIDDLQRVIDQARRAREVEFEGAERIVDHHARRFWAWYRVRQATPAIRALRGNAQRCVETALARAKAAGPRDADREREQRLAIRATLNKILHGPTRAIRRLAEDAETADALEELASALRPTAPGWVRGRTADRGMG